MGELSDNELLRYSRQIMLPDIDIAGQQKLKDAHALIIGLGGLGSPVALYLAGAGVGALTLCDHDDVDLSNLQRQVVHNMDRLGQNKARSAAEQIALVNPEVTTNVRTQTYDEATLEAALSGVDVVLDCTDNFSTRFMINDACWRARTPLVSGAAIGWEGQLSVFDPRQTQSPCYRCLYPEGDDAALSCAENGVIAPLVGIIGTLQAIEAIKVLAGVGETLVGRVLYYDGKYAETRGLNLKRRAGCPTCAR